MLGNSLLLPILDLVAIMDAMQCNAYRFTSFHPYCTSLWQV